MISSTGKLALITYLLLVISQATHADSDANTNENCDTSEDLKYADGGRASLITLIDHWTNGINDTAQRLAHTIDDILRLYSIEEGDASTSGQSLSPACSKTLRGVQESLRRLEVWPFKMMDASGRIPWEGITDMAFVSLGDYDLCMSMNDKREVDSRGSHHPTHYCVAQLRIPLPARDTTQNRIEYGESVVSSRDSRSLATPIMAHMTRHLSVMYAVKQVRIGICTPRECSPHDTEILINHLFPLPVTETETKFRVHTNCVYPGKHKEKSHVQQTVLNILKIISIFVGLGTLLDIYYCFRSSPINSEQRNLLVQILLCFSAFTNLKKFFSCPKETSNTLGQKKFTFTYGWRSINAYWVVIGHTYLALAMPFMSLNAHNHSLLSKFFLSTGASLASASFFQLEQFFFLSGCILTYILYPVVEAKGGQVNLIAYVFHRWFRSTPSVAGVLALMILSPLAEGGLAFDPSATGDGPLYRILIEEATEPCRRNWWRVLLPVQHMYGIADSCMPETWFLSIDFYLYCIAPAALWILFKFHHMGLIALWTVIAACMAYSAQYIYSQDPQPIPDLSSSLNLQNISYLYEHVVFPVVRHVPSYFFGVFMGYILLKWKPIIFSRRTKYLISYSMFILMGAMMWVASWWRSPSGPPPKLLSAIVLSTYQLFWVIPIAWLTYLCMTGQAGWLDRFLSHRFWIPVSRLSFLLYLINFLVIGMRVSSLKRPMDMTDVFLMTSFFLMIYQQCLLAALFLNITVEMPFANLEKLIFEGALKSTSQDKSKRLKIDTAVVDESRFQINNELKMSKRVGNSIKVAAKL